MWHKTSSVHYVKILPMSNLNHVGTSLCAVIVLTEQRDAPFARYKLRGNESSYIDLNSVCKIIKGALRKHSLISKP